MRASKALLQLLVAACMGAVGLTSMTACPGEIDDPARFIPGSNCPDIEADLFPARCGTAGCHDDVTAAAMLDLVSPGVASRTVGVAATPDCDGGVLVDPSNPAQSVMYTKLTPDFCGPAQMPVTGAKLTEEELQCVFDWIAGQMGSGGAATTTTTGGGMGGMGGSAGGMDGMGGAGGSGGAGGN